MSVLSSLFPNSGKYGPDKNSIFGHISHSEREVYHYKKTHAFVNWEQVFANSSIEQKTSVLNETVFIVMSNYIHNETKAFDDLA